jgi:hypothetical protein
VLVLGSDVNPEPGDLAGCEVTFSVDGVHVYDPGPSSGIYYVGFKYRVPGYINSLTLSPEFHKDDGGWVGDAWDATYSGTLTIDVYPGWYATETGDDIVIELWVKVVDNEGRDDVVWVGQYTIDDACDDPPAPTPTASDTPEPTATSDPSATPEICRAVRRRRAPRGPIARGKPAGAIILL